MSAKAMGWVEIIAGIAIDYFTGGTAGNSLIMAGIATEASIYLAPRQADVVTSQAPIAGTTIQTDAYSNLVYGTMRMGGVLVYENTTGSENGILDMVVEHALTDPAYGIDGFGSFWLNDQELRVRSGAAWIANHNYGVGDALIDSNSNAQVCVTEGESGATHPTWKTAKGQITDDNTAQWKMVGTHTADITWNSGTVGADGYVRPESGKSYIHGHVTGGTFAGTVELWAYIGTQATSDDLDGTLNTAYGDDPDMPWLESAVGVGRVWTHWRFTAGSDPEKFQAAYGGALPYKIEAIIRGEKILDIRTSTRGYSENPALIARDFYTRDRANGGCEMAASLVDDVNATIPSANVCDQRVTFADGTQGPRFTCNGAVRVGNNCIDELGKIVASMAGFIVSRSLSAENGAPLAFYSGSYSSPSGTLDASFLRGNTQFQTPTQDISYNNVRATFIDRNNAYQQMSAPPVPALNSATFAAWKADDGGVETDKGISMDFVTDSDHAQIVAGVIANQSRYLETSKLECNLKALAFNVFDRVWCANDELAIDGDVYRMTRMTLRPDFGVDVYLMRDTESVWGSVIPQIGPVVGDTYVRHTIAPVPTGLVVSPQVWGHLLQWDAPDPTYVARTEVWVSPDNVTFALLGRTAGNSYNNHVPAHTQKWYELRSSNRYGLSDFCASVSAFSGDALDPGDQVFDDLIINGAFELESNWTGGGFFKSGGFNNSGQYYLTAAAATMVFGYQTTAQGDPRYIPVAPGDLLYMSIRCNRDVGNASFVVQLTGYDQNLANPNYTMQVVNPSEGGTFPLTRRLFQVPAGVYRVRPAFHINDDGTANTRVKFDEYHLYKNSFDYTNVLPTTASSAFSYEYNATTEVLTISWDDTLEIFWGDDSTTAIAAGSQDFDVPLPPPGNPVAKYAYPYWPLLGGGVTFALAGIYDGPSTAAAQEQNLTQNIPLSIGPIVIYVSTSGGSGTGIGGGGGCLHPDMPFTARRAGRIVMMSAAALQRGDEVKTPDGWAPIERMTRGAGGQYIRIEFDNGAHMTVTPTEPMFRPDMSKFPARDLRLGDILAGRERHLAVTRLAAITDSAQCVRLHIPAPHHFFAQPGGPLLHNTFKY